MNFVRQHIEAHLFGGRRNAVQKEHRNYTLSLMLYKRLCGLFPKVNAAAINHVGPLA